MNSRNSQAAALAVAVREAGERSMARANAGLGILAVESLMATRPGLEPDLVRVTMEILDDALQTTSQVFDVGTPRQLAGIIRAIAGQNRVRVRARDRLLQLDGIAFVDELTENAIEQSGETVGRVAGQLIAGEQVVTLLAPHGPQVKVWLVDGRVCCSFEPEQQVRWTSTSLVVRAKVFEMYLTAIVGCPLRKVVEHPMLPGGLRISAARRAGDDLELSLRLKSRPVLIAEIR